MEDYILKDHTTKLNQTDNKKTSRITNYIPHHAVANVNKPSKGQILFAAGTKAKGKSLNKHLLKGHDFLSNLANVLLKFCERQFAIIDDITQMFHQVQVLPADRDALRFHRHKGLTHRHTQNKRSSVWENRFSLLLKLGIKKNSIR